MKLADLTSSPAMKISLMALSLIAVCFAGIRIWKATDPVSEMVMPLRSMLHLQLSPEHQIQTYEWDEDCVVQARLNLQRRGMKLTAEDLLPFPGTTVGHELYAIWGRGMANCGVLGQNIVASVARELNRFTTPSGASMAVIWRDHLGLEAPDIARLLVLRAVRQQTIFAGSAIVPSLQQIEWNRRGESP